MSNTCIFAYMRRTMRLCTLVMYVLQTKWSSGLINPGYTFHRDASHLTFAPQRHSLADAPAPNPYFILFTADESL